jgi:hypothetical protein
VDYNGKLRLLKAIAVYEVSVVTWGMNELARVETVKRRAAESVRSGRLFTLRAEMQRDAIGRAIGDAARGFRRQLQQHRR